jgi:alkylation response protein AidB-like acyl-CoA dehydrogenase
VVPFQTSFERPTTIGPVAQLLHAAIDLGVARAALAATLPFVREKPGPGSTPRWPAPPRTRC